jgi:hypothetical protein
MSYRAKIGLVGTVLVLGVIVAAYVGTVSPLATTATKGVDAAVKRASRLVTRIQRLKGFELLGMAESIARQKDFVKAIQVAPEEERRKYVFDAIQQYDQKLRKEGRKAHFLGVVDTNGAVIARDLDINNMYGEKLPYQNIKKALSGEAAKDIINMNKKMMRAAAAPILVGTQVKAAVVVAYEVTAADAREERDQFGTHVAYFMDDVVRASSFSMAGDDNAEDATMVEAATRALLGSASAPGKDAIAKDKDGDVAKIVLQNETYLAIAGPLPVRLTSPNVGYVVLSSLTAAQDPVTRVRWMYLVLGIAMLLLVIGGMFLVARHFVNAEDKLELGVSEVINGNMEYTFEAVEEFEGLANAINVMLARLLGRPEPGEEGEESDAMWRADVIFVDELDVGPSPDLSRKLAAEPEDTYYSRIFYEYVEARKRSNLPVEGITLESLTQKLRANEALLRAKHKCQMVRFTFSLQSGKVSLKPVRIG